LSPRVFVFVNDLGVALYKKFGFQIEGTHYLYAYRNGEYTDAYSMARITQRDS
jgi:putative acetyltransferase